MACAQWCAQCRASAHREGASTRRESRSRSRWSLGFGHSALFLVNVADALDLAVPCSCRSAPLRADRLVVRRSESQERHSRFFEESLLLPVPPRPSSEGIRAVAQRVRDVVLGPPLAPLWGAYPQAFHLATGASPRSRTLPCGVGNRLAPRPETLAEGGGVEPLGVTLPWHSTPVAHQRTAPSRAVRQADRR